MSDPLRELERDSIRAFVASCSDRLTGRVLDYGAGRMPYRGIVEDAGGEYVPFDRVGFPGAVAPEDLGSAHFKNGEWDVLLATQMLQYVEDPAGLVNHWFRLLRPGGVLILTGPTNWPVVEREDLFRLTPAGAARLVSSGGFRVESVESRGSVAILGQQFSVGYGLVAFRACSFIYGIVEPLSGVVRYVGKTEQSPVTRLRQHIGAARRSSDTRNHLCNWIRSLERDPLVTVLEADPEDIDAAERRWIGKLRNEGVKLCNMTNGGDGRPRGFTHSKSELQRRREYRHSPEARARIAASNTGKKRGPGFAEKMAEIARQRPSKLSDDDVRAIRASDEKGDVLAVRYGISPTYVSAVRRGRARSHIT